jgi:hypothetical protein
MEEQQSNYQKKGKEILVMGLKGEPDTKTNWSTGRRPQDQPTNQPTNFLVSQFGR